MLPKKIRVDLLALCLQHGIREMEEEALLLVGGFGENLMIIIDNRAHVEWSGAGRRTGQAEQLGKAREKLLLQRGSGDENVLCCNDQSGG